MRTLLREWRRTLLLVIGTGILIFDHYHRHQFTDWQRGLIFLLVPFFTLLVLRQNPAQYGFRLGNWRRGLLITGGAILLTTPILWLFTRGADFRNYYGGVWAQGGWLGTLAWTVSDLFGWEFFFRGFWLFTLLPIAGDWALLLQAVPFTMAHFGKPELETWSCIVGGTAFGWVAQQTGSFLYPFLIHTYVAFFTTWIAAH